MQEKFYKKITIEISLPVHDNISNAFNSKYDVSNIKNKFYLDPKPQYDISNSIHIDPIRGVVEIIRDGKVIDSTPIVPDDDDEEEDEEDTHQQMGER